MSDPIDLVSDAALSALVDGELAPGEERALRERIAADPALAARFERFEAVTRVLRSAGSDAGADSGAAASVDPAVGLDALAERLAARIAADSVAGGSASLDDAPPVFADERAVQTEAVVVGFPARGRALRIGVRVAVALAAALAVYALVSRPGPPAPGGVSPESEAPQLAHEAPAGARLGGSEPQPAAGRAAPLPGATPPGVTPIAPGQLAARPTAEQSGGLGTRPTEGQPGALAARSNAEQPSGATTGSEPDFAAPLAADDETLELYALALDDEVVGPDFDVIDNLELLEVLAALEAGDPRG